MPEEMNILARLGSSVYGSLIHSTYVLGQSFQADVAALRLFGVSAGVCSSFVHVKNPQDSSEARCRQWCDDPNGLFSLIQRAGRRLTVYTPEELLALARLQGVVKLSPPTVRMTDAVMKRAAAGRHIHSEHRGRPSRQAYETHEAHDVQDVMHDEGPQLHHGQDTHDAEVWESTAELFEGLDDVCQIEHGLCVNVAIHGRVWGAVALMRCRHAKPFRSEDTQCLTQIRPALSHTLRSGCARQGIISLAPTPQAPQHKARQMTLEQAHLRLTRAERQVLGYLRLSATEREISQEIHRSPHTVHVHVKNIYRKLEVNSRAELLELLGDGA